MISLDDLIQQSQTHDPQGSELEREIVSTKPEDHPPAIGREKSCETAREIIGEPEFFIDSDLILSKIERKVIELDNVNLCEDFDNYLRNETEENRAKKEVIKNTPGMRWHRRLGHALRPGYHDF